MKKSIYARRSKEYKNLDTPKRYKESEKNLPKDAVEFRTKCPAGGFYVSWIKKTSRGFDLYLGDNREEPTFKVQHSFKTKNEAIYYAAYAWLSTDELFLD